MNDIWVVLHYDPWERAAMVHSAWSNKVDAEACAKRSSMRTVEHIVMDRNPGYD